jgi:hypothetical protein
LAPITKIGAHKDNGKFRAMAHTVPYILKTATEQGNVNLGTKMELYKKKLAKYMDEEKIN